MPPARLAMRGFYGCGIVKLVLKLVYKPLLNGNAGMVPPKHTYYGFYVPLIGLGLVSHEVAHHLDVL